MKLTNLTDEEKRVRKLKQRADAQKRYYEKHKDYYKDYNIERTKKAFNSIKEIRKFIEEEKNLLGDDFWGSGFDTILEILEK